MSPKDCGSTDECIQLVEDAAKDENENKEKSSFIHYLISVIVLLVGVVAAPVTTACAQALGGVVPPFELNLWRYVAELVLITPFFLAKSRDVKPECSQVKWLLLAALMSSSYNGCFYTASLYLPLATQSGLASVFSLIILSVVTLTADRKCTIPLAVAVLLVLTGAIFMTQPEVIFRARSKIVYNPVCTKDTQPLLNKTWGESEMNTQYFIDLPTNLVTVTSGLTTNLSRSSASAASPLFSSSPSAPNQVIGYALMMGSSSSLAVQAYVVNKKISDIHYSLVNFCVSVTGIIVSVILTTTFEEFTFPPTVACTLLLLGHGIALGITNICELRSFQVFQPTIVSLAYRLCLVLAFVAQRTVMKSINPGNQNNWEIVGILLVLIGNSLNPLYQIYMQLANFKSSDWTDASISRCHQNNYYY